MKSLILVIYISALAFLPSAIVLANGGHDHTLEEEKEGKEVWERLQNKKLACADLTEDDFAVLGEYFMGTMLGDAHSVMNEMMTKMHSEKGEEQIHVVMGKRLSGCDTSAAFPAGSMGWMPMINMMTGLWSGPQKVGQSQNTMMNNFVYGPFGWLGWVFMLAWWILILAGIIALIKWLVAQFGRGGKSALDILKERYARGEISRQEFEEKRREIL